MIVNADCDTLADCKPKLSLGLTQNKLFARDCILAYFCRMTHLHVYVSVYSQEFVHGGTPEALYIHTPWAIKKRATFIFTITLANVDRFQ